MGGSRGIRLLKTWCVIVRGGLSVGDIGRTGLMLDLLVSCRARLVWVSFTVHRFSGQLCQFKAAASYEVTGSFASRLLELIRCNVRRYKLN